MRRFIIAFALVVASMAYCVNSDVHSPHIFRVNAALPMIDS